MHLDEPGKHPGQARVFLAIFDCTDLEAIARLQEFLPHSTLIGGDGADLAETEVLADPFAPADPHTLTGRQRDVLSYLLQGLSNKEIARLLGISHFTVRNHVSRILQFLQLTSRRELELLDPGKTSRKAA